MKRNALKQIASHVNFETQWQTHEPITPTSRIFPKPRFLGEKRTVRLAGDPRFLPNVIARMMQDKHFRKWQRTTPRQKNKRPLNRRAQIAVELGCIFANCNFSDAREIIRACDQNQEHALLSAFFLNQHWRETKLGKELAPLLGNSEL